MLSVRASSADSICKHYLVLWHMPQLRTVFQGGTYNRNSLFFGPPYDLMPLAANLLK